MTLQEELIMLANLGESTRSLENDKRTRLWQIKYSLTNNIIGFDNIEIKASINDPTPLGIIRPEKIIYGFTSKIFPDLPMRYIATYYDNDTGLTYIDYEDLLQDEFFNEKHNGLMINRSFELFEKGHISGFVQDRDWIFDGIPVDYIKPVVLIKAKNQDTFDNFVRINNQLKQIYTESKPFYYIPIYENGVVGISAVYNKQAGIFEYIGNNIELIKENGKIKDIYCLDDKEISTFTFPEFFEDPANILIYSKSTSICLNSITNINNL